MSYEFCAQCGKPIPDRTCPHRETEQRPPEPTTYKGYNCEDLLRSHRRLAGLLSDVQETIDSYREYDHE